MIYVILGEKHILKTSAIISYCLCGLIIPVRVFLRRTVTFQQPEQKLSSESRKLCIPQKLYKLSKTLLLVFNPKDY